MRRAFILSVLFVITGGITWWLLARSMAKPQDADPWAAVPVDAAVVIDMPDPITSWQRFVNTSQFWSDWSANAGCASFDALMHELAEATATDAHLTSAMRGSHALVMLINDGGRLGMASAWPLRLEPASLEKVGSALHLEQTAIQHLLNGDVQTIHRTDLPDLRIVHREGLLLVATSEALLGDVTAHLNTGNAETDDELIRARKSSGASADIRLYAHVQRTQRLLGNWIMARALEGLDGAEGWIALDGELRADALLLSGWMSESTAPKTVKPLHAASSTALFAAAVLPPNVHHFQEITTNNLRDHLTGLNGTAIADSLYDTWAAWCNGTFITAEAGHANDSSLTHWAVLRATDPIEAATTLDAANAGVFDTIRYRGVRISALPKGSTPEQVYGMEGMSGERLWWCSVNDAIVISDRPGGMRAVIDAYADGSALAQTEAGFFDRTAGTAVFTWFAHADRGLPEFAEQCTDKGKGVLRSGQGALGAIGDLLLQLSPAQNGWFINLCVGRNARAAEPGERSALWTVSIDAPLVAGPELVTDHISRTQQVLVQDEKDRIALISCTGKLIWQRAIDGPIMGEVHQVDKFRNGKLQMLFNTATHIHLVDRNGKDVDGFPVVLPEKASAPLSVFDYENKREYRVLVPTTEARLLNYGLDGKPVQGWVPPQTPATCAVPVEHVRMRGKDHLILVDGGGHITVLDRRGETRFAPKLGLKNVERLIGLVPAMDVEDLAVLWSDAAGNMLSGRLSGAVDTLYTKEGAPIKDIVTSTPQKERADGSTLVIKNAMLFPSPAPIGNGDSRSTVSDINLDGNKERVVVRNDGRVSAEPVQP